MNQVVVYYLPILILLALIYCSHQFQLKGPIKHNLYPSNLSNSKIICSASSSTDSNLSVLCVGETLWDCLPDGSYLGGAPTNVAIHLASLGTRNVAMAACIGSDELGYETMEILNNRDVITDHMQYHTDLGTGKVLATIDESGDATYTFDTPSAWDDLELTESLSDAVSSASVIVIGSIAGRLGTEAKSTSTLKAIREIHSNIIFDVNLRPPWYEVEFVLDLAKGNDRSTYPLALLKVNDEELVILEEWIGFEASPGDNLSGEGLRNRMEKVGRALNSKRVCVTRGENGAALWCDKDDSSSSVFSETNGFPKVDLESNGSDTVGAGDSFLAALIRSLFIEKESPHIALSRGCALGGYVASCKGATPMHENAPAHMKKVFSFFEN